VLLSTHIVGDVEAVASRLTVLRSGQALTDTSPQELTQQAIGSVWELTTDALTAHQLQERCQISAIIQRPEGIQMRVVSADRPLEGARDRTEFGGGLLVDGREGGWQRVSADEKAG
jgi:ABC-type multidrug transport system ATPase subunit